MKLIRTFNSQKSKVFPLLILCFFAMGKLQAAPQDIDLTTVNAEHIEDLTLLAPANLEIRTLGFVGQIFWGFNATPTAMPGYTQTTTVVAGEIVLLSFTVNGITVSLPPGTPASVDNTAPVVVSGAPDTPGDIFFTLLATDASDPSLSQSRTYRLSVARNMDVVLVLDRSGSMNSNTAAGISRWEALRGGVESFMTAHQGLGRTGDRISITYFETDLAPVSACCNNFQMMNGAIGTTVDGDIGGQTVGGLTGLGRALKNAEAKLSDATKTRAIILYTDGEQNQDPEVNEDGTSYSDGTSINGGGAVGPGSIRIITIGIGGPMGTYLTTLQNLAFANRGGCNITTDGSDFSFSPSSPGSDPTFDLSSGFNDAFVTALAEFSPQLIKRTDTDVRNGSGPIELQTFSLNKQVDKLLVQVFFNRRFEINQLQEVLTYIRVRQDGTIIDPTGVKWTGNYTNNAVLVFDFPGVEDSIPSYLNPPEGEWKVDILDAANFGLSTVRVTSIADDHRLDYHFSYSPNTPKVGDELKMSMNLSWEGYPLKSAEVEAIVLRPGEDLGDLLARNSTIVDVNGGPDSGNPGVQKFEELLANDEDFRNALKLQQNLVELKHGGDGKYEGAFNNLTVSGTYQIIYRISASNDTTGTIERFGTESFYATFPDVDLEASGITTKVDDDRLVIRFRPIASNNKFIGPGLGKGFKVNDQNVNIEDVQDHQDGSYTLTFAGDLGANVVLQLLNRDVYKGRLTQIGKEPGPIQKILDWVKDTIGLPAWLAILILILLILLILYLLWKRRQASS